MLGTDSTTGKAIEGVDRLRQSIADILTTPIGSRVMRRDYGSRLPELVDSPVGRSSPALLAAATAEALAKWEPEFAFESLAITAGGSSGAVTLTVRGTRKLTGKPLTLDVSVQ